MGRFRAVVFDLSGTLLDFPTREYYSVAEYLGRLAGADGRAFHERFWAQTNQPGREADWRVGIRRTWKELSLLPSPADQEAAFARYFDFERAILEHPKPGAIEILRDLKAARYRTGLITNTVHPLPEVWPNCSFSSLIDVPVFSCVEGTEKPDPAIYRACAEWLGVQPDDCLFVGDGSSDELAGAEAAGMSAVMCYVPDGDLEYVAAFGRAEWDGPRITEFAELLGLVDAR